MKSIGISIDIMILVLVLLGIKSAPNAMALPTPSFQ